MTPAPDGVILLDLAARTGGAEKRVLQLAKALPASGVPAVVVALRGSPLARQASDAGLPVATLRSAKWDPRNVCALRRVLRAYPDWTVDAHNTQSQLAALLTLDPSGRGFVATVHSEYRRSEGPGGRAGGQARGLLLRLLEQRGWSMVAVSSTVADYLAQLGVPPGRVHTVWSAVEPPQRTEHAERSEHAERTEPEADDRSRIRAQLRVPADATLLLAAGRLVPAKNYPQMLEIAAALIAPDSNRSDTSLVLAIAGDGPLRASLQQQATRLGLDDRVLFLGHRADVPALLAAADAVLLTSSTEGLPYTLLEAAAAGVPIITTPVGAIGEVFADGAAVLLPTHDVPAAATIVRQALADPLALEQTRARAHAVVSRRLTLDRMTAATLAAYSAGDPSRRGSHKRGSHNRAGTGLRCGT